jgi:hypothetical protein
MPHIFALCLLASRGENAAAGFVHNEGTDWELPLGIPKHKHRESQAVASRSLTTIDNTLRQRSVHFDKYYKYSARKLILAAASTAAAAVPLEIYVPSR